MVKRDKLPAFLKLNLKFDPDRIRSEFYAAKLDDFSRYNDLKPGGSVYEAGCQYRPEFLKNFISDSEALEQQQKGHDCFVGGESYGQLAMTEFQPLTNDRAVDIARERGAGPIRRVKRVISSDSGYVDGADERNFTQLSPHATGVFAEIIQSFKAPFARCRLAYMRPGFMIKPHIDFNTDYAIRVHVPIITNVNAIIGVRHRGRVVEQHLPADGSVWFVNAGYPHYAFNKGDTPRVHFIITLVGQQDLEGAIEYEG